MYKLRHISPQREWVCLGEAVAEPHPPTPTPEVNLTRTVHLIHFYSFVTLHDMLHAKLLLQILVRVRSIV